MKKRRQCKGEKELKAIDFLELIRSERKVSQEEIAEFASSLTNYKRYLRGEIEMPLKKAIAFVEYLGLNPNHLLEQLGYIDRSEDLLITRLVNTIVTLDYNEYHKLFEKIDPNNILKESNRILYQYALILFDSYTKNISKTETMNKLKSLINYPQILKVKKISASEFMVIGEIVTLAEPCEQEVVFFKLKDLLENPRDVIFDGNQKVILSLLTRMARVLGENRQYDATIFLCKKGINICCAMEYTYCLDYFYYYLALCYHNLEDFKMRNEIIPYVVIAAIVQRDYGNLEKFCNLIYRDFGVEALEIFNEYIKTFKQK